MARYGRARGRQVQKAVRTRDERLARLSHRLRTPLNVIQGWTYVLEHGADARTLQRGVAAIRRSVSIQVGLIEDLLEAAGGGAGRRRLVGSSILAVDDNPDALEALAAVLEQEGARVARAGSVREALAGLERTLGEGSPGAVLCDIELPGEDGYQFLARLRAVERRREPPAQRRIPVIAVSANTKARERALAAGFEDYVAKPIDSARLLDALNRVLGRDVPAAPPKKNKTFRPARKRRRP